MDITKIKHRICVPHANMILEQTDESSWKLFSNYPLNTKAFNIEICFEFDIQLCQRLRVIIWKSAVPVDTLNTVPLEPLFLVADTPEQIEILAKLPVEEALGVVVTPRDVTAVPHHTVAVPHIPACLASVSKL